MMGAEAAVRTDFNGVWNEELHRRFLLWKDQSGRSIAVISGMVGRSSAAISGYMNKVYKGNVGEVEKDIEGLLRREEDFQFVSGPKTFVNTEAAKLIYEVLFYCDANQVMGAALAPSGTGKTEACKEYKRQNRGTLFITADITTQRPRPILRRLVRHVGGIGRRISTSEFLQALIDRLRGSRRLLIIDDGHFLGWEAHEALRKIHDSAGTGICFVGQERLYTQMRGTEDDGYLFDQIYSRIAIKRDRFRVTRDDVRKITETVVPGLPKECDDYLFEIAKGKARYRRLTNLLQAAQQIQTTYQTPIDLRMLQDAERLLMGG